MKKRLIPAILLVMCILFGACSGQEDADVGALLKTVPSDVSLVSVINVRSLLEKAGCEVKDSKVIPGKEVKEFLKEETDSSFSSAAASFFAEDNGIDPSVAVMFIEGYDRYIVGLLTDTEAFKKMIEKRSGEPFNAVEGIDVCGNIAVKDLKFWVNISRRNDIDASEIKRFLSLSEKQSFISDPISSSLSEMKKDIEGWSDIRGSINSSDLDFSSKGMAVMALEMIFSDATQTRFSVDIVKNKGELTLNILNSKNGNAKFLFPTDKVNTESVKAIGGDAEIVAAAAINSKFVKYLQEQTSGKGVSMLGSFAVMLKGVDGTCALAGGRASDAYRGFITTDGSGVDALTRMLSEMGTNVTKDGKLLKISGDTAGGGSMKVEDAAPLFRNAMFGMVTSGAFLDAPMLSEVSVMFVPSGNSLELKIVAESKDKKNNFLLQLLKWRQL